jgi:UDP-N-acetylglucosamine:LPS N-acetylglucosamine transferase
MTLTNYAPNRDLSDGCADEDQVEFAGRGDGRAGDLPKRILLVADSGGHLLQMLALEGAFDGLERLFVTLSAPDSTNLLADEPVVFAHGPTNRNLHNFARNLLLAWRTVRDHDPDVILSTGAALAVPFFLVGRLRRKRLVYVESFTRVNQLSLSGRMVYPLADAFFVQWRKNEGRRRALYAGSVV